MKFAESLLTIASCCTIALGGTGCATLRRFLVPLRQQEANSEVARRAAEEAKFAEVIVASGGIRGTEPTTVALALRDEKIIGRGTLDALETMRGPQTRVLRWPDAQTMSGLVDAHVDLRVEILTATSVALATAKDANDVEKLVLAARGRVLDTGWLWGAGASTGALAQLTVAGLDKVAGDLPVAVFAAKFDHVILNGAAIKLLPNELREIAVAAAGRLHGAQARAVWRHLPEPQVGRYKPLLLQLLNEMQRHGVIEIHAMDVTAIERIALQSLEKEGRLPLRVSLFLDAELPEGQLLLLPPAPPPLLDAPTVDKSASALRKPWQPRLARVIGLHQHLDNIDENGVPSLQLRDERLRVLLQDADREHVQLALSVATPQTLEQLLRILATEPRPEGALPIQLLELHQWDAALISQLQKSPRASLRCVAQPMQTAAAPWSKLDQYCPLLIGTYATGIDALAAWRQLDAALVTEAGQAQHADSQLLQQAVENAEKQALTAATATGASSATANGAVPNGAWAVGQLADFVVWSRDPLASAPRAIAAEVFCVAVNGIVSVISAPTTTRRPD